MYVTGCSAGGGAALQWMHEMARNDHYFGGVIPISPWSDIAVNSEVSSYAENGHLDSMLDLDGMRLFKMYALGCRDAEGREMADDMDQCIESGLKELERREMNPLTADWSSWSGKEHDMKMMFVASQYEVLRDDAISAHRKAEQNGIDATMEMTNSRLHCLPLFVQTPEGLEYAAKIAQFISRLHSERKIAE